MIVPSNKANGESLKEPTIPLKLSRFSLNSNLKSPLSYKLYHYYNSIFKYSVYSFSNKDFKSYPLSGYALITFLPN